MNHTLDLAAPRAERLVLRPWRISDELAASQTYDHPDTTYRSSPSTPHVSGRAAVRRLLDRWATQVDGEEAPVGRWAIERDHRVIGGASLLPLPPGNHDLEIAWQLNSTVAQTDHDDHVTEIVSALAAWAFGHYVDEVFAVARPNDARTAEHVARSGMRWVGETTKYFDLHLQVYRLRPADLLGAVQRPAAFRVAT